MKKMDKIAELQQKVFQIEQENLELKSKNSGESINLKELKQNYDQMKANLLDSRNQYELINIKYQTLSEENFSLKRDMIYLEKEVKNKSELIERLRNEVLDSNKKNMDNYSSNYATSGYKEFESSNKQIPKKEAPIQNSTSNLNRKENDQKIPENSKITKKNYYKDSVTNNFTVLPSQVNVIKNESKMQELESRLAQCHREKDQVDISHFRSR